MCLVHPAGNQAVSEEDEEHCGNHVHEPVNFLAAALHQADEDVGQEACADTVRDGVCQGHEDDGHERGDTDPSRSVDVHCLANHQEADEHHCGCNSFRRAMMVTRGVRKIATRNSTPVTMFAKPGACTRADTGCGLHENLARGRRRIPPATEPRGVHEQDLVDVLDLAVLDGAYLPRLRDRREVPIASKKAEIRMVKISRTGAMPPRVPKALNRSAEPNGEKSGDLLVLESQTGTFRDQPVGDNSRRRRHDLLQDDGRAVEASTP